MRILTAALAVLSCVALAPPRAVASPQRCEVTKLRAAGTEFTSQLACHARGGSNATVRSCVAEAAAKRDEAFQTIDGRGGCATVGDSKSVGDKVAARTKLMLGLLQPKRSRTSQCVERTLLAASRASSGFTSLFAHGGGGRNEDRFPIALERIRVNTQRALERAIDQGSDCPYTSAIAGNSRADIEFSVAALRDMTCPTCGVVCPCWTTAELDKWFPAGAFDKFGGVSCSLIALGYEIVASADLCSDRRFGTFFREGFGVFGDLCLLASSDLDPDANGTCDVAPLNTRVTPSEGAICFDDMKAARIYPTDCAVPN